MAPFQIVVALDGDTARLRVSGELDLEHADALRDAVLAAQEACSGDIEIDLANVSFLDSSGIAALVVARRLAATERRHVRVANPQRRVAQVLEVTGADIYLGLDT